MKNYVIGAMMLISSSSSAIAGGINGVEFFFKGDPFQIQVQKNIKCAAITLIGARRLYVDGDKTNGVILKQASDRFINYALDLMVAKNNSEKIETFEKVKNTAQLYVMGYTNLMVSYPEMWNQIMVTDLGECKELSDVQFEDKF